MFEVIVGIAAVLYIYDWLFSEEDV